MLIMACGLKFYKARMHGFCNPCIMCAYGVTNMQHTKASLTKEPKLNVDEIFF